jgi:hypothetical protein
MRAPGKMLLATADPSYHGLEEGLLPQEGHARGLSKHAWLTRLGQWLAMCLYPAAYERKVK